MANFEFNSDQLTQAARENLDQFAKAIKDPRLAGWKFEIDGRQRRCRPRRDNQGLSERRADAVVSDLASDGIDKSLLLAKGFGKSKPEVASSYSPENLACRNASQRMNEARCPRPPEFGPQTTSAAAGKDLSFP